MSRPTILCATDLGEEGARAVDLASAFGRALDARVVLIHATDAIGASEPPEAVPESMGEGAEALRRRLEERLRAEQAALEEHRQRCEQVGVECDAALVEGRPGEALVREATDRLAALIVVGRRERDGGHRVGPTIHHVVRHADCPVAVTPTDGQTTTTLEQGRWLVGVDFSRQSESALLAARALAAACGGDLVLVHVADPGGGEESTDGRRTPDQILRREGNREALLELEAWAGEEGPPARAVQRVGTGEPADQLCSVAVAEKAIAMVVGTHGRTGLGRFFLGSVADDLLRRSPMPVVVVRELPQHVAPWFRTLDGPAPALSPNHLLVAVDFSEASRRALVQAKELAARLGVAVSVVHVHEPPHDVRHGLLGRVAAAAGPAPSPADEETLTRLRRSLSELVEQVFGADNEAITVTVETGRPVECIIGVARATNADLVIAGTTGRAGVERALLGSVAERLVRECPVPVLTVH